jgi:protein SCO1
VNLLSVSTRLAAATLVASLALVSGRVEQPLVPTAAHAFPQNPSGAREGVAGDDVPKPLQGIEITDNRGVELAKDLHFRNQDGRDVTLGSYFEGKPVVLVMAYYECPMLCTIVLNGLNAGLKDLAWTPGREFRVVTVSFDKRDTPEAARKKRQVYVDAYGRPIDDRGWDFLVSDEATVVQLAKTIGFGYRWDAKTDQFAHAAGAFIISPKGVLSNTLLGIQFPERDLRLSLTEASEGKLGSAWDRVMLLCYHYDPNEHSYVLAGRRFMRAGGTLSALLLGVFLARLWRRELRKQPEAHIPGSRVPRIPGSQIPGAPPGNPDVT